ncbi:MAG: hypothetical protein HC837_15345 [Chloroflexaceae bacterium]|nr:hypothetical protein [Chloroflexaceae bacterium]
MRGSPLPIIFVLGLVGIILAVGVTGILAPIRLSFMQEQVLSLLHNGVADEFEETTVENCVPTNQGPRAVPQTRRRVTYRDGTVFEIVIRGQPVPSNAQC